MNEMMRNTLALLCAALAIAALPGCTPAQPGAATAPPLAGARIGGPFTLTDQDGRRFSDRQLAGKYRIHYFGYTFCPDVCPVDLQNIAAALQLLDKSDPALAARIVPVFITVDPERDSPRVLKEFVGAFDPRIVGLTGTPAEIRRVADSFAIFYEKQPPRSDGSYIVGHQRIAYLFDPDGKPVALLPQDRPPAEIAAEIKRWAR